MKMTTLTPRDHSALAASLRARVRALQAARRRTGRFGTVIVAVPEQPKGARRDELTGMIAAYRTVLANLRSPARGVR